MSVLEANKPSLARPSRSAGRFSFTLSSRGTARRLGGGAAAKRIRDRKAGKFTTVEELEARIARG